VPHEPNRPPERVDDERRLPVFGAYDAVGRTDSFVLFTADRDDARIAPAVGGERGFQGCR
jgi:hypothetical protein